MPCIEGPAFIELDDPGFIREVGALRTLEFSSKANRKNGWGGMDCGSLLPLLGGQHAGRRASNGIRIFHRSRSGGSHIIFSITQGLRRRQAAAVQDMPLSQVSEDSMLLHRTNFPDEPDPGGHDNLIVGKTRRMMG
jgi:hypothetical protein